VVVGQGTVDRVTTGGCAYVEETGGGTTKVTVLWTGGGSVCVSVGGTQTEEIVGGGATQVDVEGWTVMMGIGQIVVSSVTVTVVTAVLWAGQSGTSGPQSMIVLMWVAVTVLVPHSHSGSSGSGQG
jgi:hypothetical protein